MTTHQVRREITRKLEFDAAHRVLGHEGHCKHLHGHRYVAEVTVSCPELDSLGRVIDFGAVKEKAGRWILANWDHNFLCHRDDPLLELDGNHYLSGKDPYVMPNGNPTAENMAEELFRVATGLLSPLRIVRIRIYETPNCFADFTSD